MWRVAFLAALPFLGSTGDFFSHTDVLRSRLAALDPSMLAGEKIRLELFASETVEAVRDTLVPQGPDGFTWVGHAAGDETSSIVLSFVRGTLSGSVRRGSAQYRIRPQEAGLYRVEEVAPSSEPPERLPLHAGATSAPPARLDVDDGSVLDLLVVYTPRARRAAGGSEAIASLVGLGVAEANLALEKSEVEARLRLVELSEVSFAESGRAESDLEILRDERDGALDEVHRLRDRNGADVVQLVVEEGDGCGIAYSMGRSGASFSEWAFSVVERSCIDSTYAMAHELGHNLGCDHAPEDPTTNGAFAYSFGYKDLVAGFRTIMAYGPGTTRRAILESARAVRRCAHGLRPAGQCALVERAHSSRRALSPKPPCSAGFHRRRRPSRELAHPALPRGARHPRMASPTGNIGLHAAMSSIAGSSWANFSTSTRPRSRVRASRGSGTAADRCGRSKTFSGHAEFGVAFTAALYCSGRTSRYSKN